MPENNTITIWKDGTWKIWGCGDAIYAQADPDFLLNISMDQISKMKEAEDAIDRAATALSKAAKASGLTVVEEAQG